MSAPLLLSAVDHRANNATKPKVGKAQEWPPSTLLCLRSLDVGAERRRTSGKPLRWKKLSQDAHIVEMFLLFPGCRPRRPTLTRCRMGSRRPYHLMGEVSSCAELLDAAATKFGTNWASMGFQFAAKAGVGPIEANPADVRRAVEQLHV